MKIVVVGGGPAGSFFTLEARKAGLSHPITVIDQKDFSKEGLHGCNLCAGVLSHEVQRALFELGIAIPESVIQSTIEHLCLIVNGRYFYLSYPDENPFITVYRGSGPPGSSTIDASFDLMLKNASISSNCEWVSGRVTSIEPSENGALVRLNDGDKLQASVVIVATGVNDKGEDPVPFLKKPPCYRAVQIEMPYKAEKVTEKFKSSITAIFPDNPEIDFFAITPKRACLTLTLIGTDVSPELMDITLQDPSTRAILESVGAGSQISCRCQPLFPCGMAERSPYPWLFSIGDRLTSRLYKNGLGSAHFMAKSAVKSLYESNSIEEANSIYYSLVKRRFSIDNSVGNAIFSMMRFLKRNPKSLSLLLSQAEKDYTAKKTNGMDRILWGIFTGDIPYRTLMKWGLSRTDIRVIIRSLF